MKIDDRSQAMALTEKLKASLPMKVRPGKQFLRMLKEKGEIANPDREYEVTSVLYSGDEGGISCALASETTDKTAYVVSITHLEVDSSHPLAAELKEYQSQRTRKLFLQDKGGFAKELLANKSVKPKKRSSGFGK
ncbi:MAG: hypothetical protein HC903_29450 [Methylacidiphilales bacterium]|nr:hypothetical protein [Candidatus Methylacidiphilales bacterium]NJR16629.1 hypothetical protein [Calothrix sp. CSU_2_0]